MPPGAFLRQPAESVQALNRQIHTDSLVCQRYARLYNMPVQDVREAFAHLRLTQLSQDRIFQIHYIHTGERIGYKVRRVRKGTPIYSFADGTPVLIQVCGNPVRPNVGPSRHVGMPPPETVVPAVVAEFDVNEAMEVAPSNNIVELNGLRSGPPGELLPPPLDFVEIPEIPLEAPTDTSTTRLHRAPPVEQIKHWGNNGLWFLPLAALPLLALSGGGGNNASLHQGPAGGPPSGPPGGPPGPPGGGLITPEPNSLSMLLAGSLACGFALYLHRRRGKDPRSSWKAAESEGQTEYVVCFLPSNDQQ
jgi:hypothetical protein